MYDDMNATAKKEFRVFAASGADWGVYRALNK